MGYIIYYAQSNLSHIRETPSPDIYRVNDASLDIADMYMLAI